MKDAGAEEFWVDNLWQKEGIRMLNEAQYTELVYGQKSDKPWLIYIAKTPYGAAESDFTPSTMLMRRIVCIKRTFGDEVNVALMDLYRSEFVRQSFDPDVSRAG